MMILEVSVVHLALLCCILQAAATLSPCGAGNESLVSNPPTSSDPNQPAPQSPEGFYLNLHHPTSCTGTITGYSYCYFLDGGMVQEVTTVTIQFSSWNCTNSVCKKIEDITDQITHSPSQGSMCHVTNSTFINDRIAKGVVIGAHITSGETQRDITLADSRPNEKFCYEASDTAVSVTCLGTALMNGALYFAVSIDPDDCDAPTVPKNGSARYLSDSQQVNTNITYPFGSIITYACDNGFRLNGTSANITCSESWTPKPPECTPVNCGFPGEPMNGVALGDDYTFQSIVTFNCSEGYGLNESSNVIYCNASRQWNGSIPVCILEPPSQHTTERRTQIGIIVAASAVAILTFIGVPVACVVGVIFTVYYLKNKEKRRLKKEYMSASREDLVYNAMYDSNKESNMVSNPNMSYGLRPKSEHLYEVIPGDRLASIKSQNREARANSYTLTTM